MRQKILLFFMFFFAIGISFYLFNKDDEYYLTIAVVDEASLKPVQKVKIIVGEITKPLFFMQGEKKKSTLTGRMIVLNFSLLFLILD